MPNGQTHDKIGMITAPAVALVVGIDSGEVGLGVLAGLAHLIGTFYLSPDLDLGSAGIDERWGLLKPLWVPYDKVIPHRSILSHSGLSVFLRVAYLALVFEIALAACAIVTRIDFWHVNEEIWALVEQFQVELYWFGVGLFTSDVAHTTADYISTSMKRRRAFRAESSGGM